MNHLEKQMTNLLPSTDKSNYNAIMIIAGVFSIIPWFLIDTTNGELTEYKALEKRHEYLFSLYNEKKCALD